MNLFAVYLTIYSGQKLPMYYLGSTNMEKLEKGYNGTVTSKKWKSIYDIEQIENKQLFKSVLLSSHSTREEAYNEEERLQRYYNVVRSSLFFNESFANGKFGLDVAGRNNPMYGKHHSKPSIDIIKYKLEKSKPKAIIKQKNTIKNRDKDEQLSINKKISDTKLNYPQSKKDDIKTKFLKNVSIIEDNNIKSINMAKNASTTKRNDIRNGKNAHERNGEKVAKIRKENNTYYTGVDHPKFKAVFIYDENGILRYTTHKNFKSFCEENLLPFTAFKNSVQTNTTLYTNISKCILKRIKANGNIKYKGWYARY